MDFIINFNKPYLTGKEKDYISEVLSNGKLSGNGKYTKLCQNFFTTRYKFHHSLLTTSCTDALEMAALLCNIGPSDEVILPSYTFVSTANPFLLRGAKLVFADSSEENPNIDASKIESLITAKTKAIVVVHYAGMACDMKPIIELAEKYSLKVIEDAAQGIDNYFISENGKRKALGSIGHLGTFSFHETKNITCGEGGLLSINNRDLINRAEIIWEKGTNRSAFYRGEIDKYGWVDIGSSFLPSEILASFLWAQLEHLDLIQKRRKIIWDLYYDGLKEWAFLNEASLPVIPNYSSNNAHLFYIVCPSLSFRNELIKKLKKEGILAVFHYNSLHKSKFYEKFHDGRNLVNSDKYSDCLLRLPLYYDLKDDEVGRIIDVIKNN